MYVGGVSVEGPAEPIPQADIRGLFNLYEAARLAGTRRIVVASSNPGPAATSKNRAPNP